MDVRDGILNSRTDPGYNREVLAAALFHGEGVELVSLGGVFPKSSSATTTSTDFGASTDGPTITIRLNMSPPSSASRRQARVARYSCG